MCTLGVGEGQPGTWDTCPRAGREEGALALRSSSLVSTYNCLFSAVLGRTMGMFAKFFVRR